jgi:hypothetical protein
MERQMRTPDSIEFLRMVEKSKMRRIDISKYLGIGQRTFYRWQNGEVTIPTTGMMAMYLLVGEPLPEKHDPAKI